MNRLSALLLSVVSSVSLLTTAPQIALSGTTTKVKQITIEQRLKVQIATQNTDIKKLEQKLQNLKDNTRDAFALCKSERVSVEDCNIFLTSIFIEQKVPQKLKDIYSQLADLKESNKAYQSRLNKLSVAEKKKLITPMYNTGCDIDDCD